MVKAIPFTGRCVHCNIQLTFEASDIKTDKCSYEVYHNVYEDHEYRYIVCPVCNKRLYL